MRNLKKDEFMMLIKECGIPERFDQELLDRSAAMLEKWGFLEHDPGLWNENNALHLFENFGLIEEKDDSAEVMKEKKVLRRIISKMMKTQISKGDAIGIMKNFNKIGEPGFRWLE